MDLFQGKNPNNCRNMVVFPYEFRVGISGSGRNVRCKGDVSYPRMISDKHHIFY